MAATTTLRYISVPAREKHTATVVFVHGLGDTGRGWQPVADQFKVDPALAHVKWVLPHSPIRPVAANMGIEMPSWYDIYKFGFDTTEDELGMLESARLLNQLIRDEIESGIDPSRIVLGGFSQGGTISLLTAFTNERKLGGLVVLSGWLPLKHKFKALATAHAGPLSVFWGHGTTDPLVKFDQVEESTSFLAKEMGLEVVKDESMRGLLYNKYESLGHSTTPEELDELRQWLVKVLPK